MKGVFVHRDGVLSAAGCFLPVHSHGRVEAELLGCMAAPWLGCRERKQVGAGGRAGPCSAGGCAGGHTVGSTAAGAQLE